MRIIISPAKKMRRDEDSLPWRDLPGFLPQAEELAAALGRMEPAALRRLWRCSEAIARQNVERLADMVRDICPPKELIICPHEPFTGAHVGPGMLALFFFGQSR